MLPYTNNRDCIKLILQIKYYFQSLKLRNCFAVDSFKFIPYQENKQICFGIRCTFFQKNLSLSCTSDMVYAAADTVKFQFCVALRVAIRHHFLGYVGHCSLPHGPSSHWHYCHYHKIDCTGRKLLQQRLQCHHPIYHQLS